MRALSADTAQMKSQISTVDELLENLTRQSSYGVVVAKFDGIVGSVSVQLDELVRPYTTVVTLYGGQPTVIKAYLNERTVKRSLIGSDVIVKSRSRKYEIEGRITEVGKRIVPYPEMINPGTEGTQAYGQEIFVKIPADNQFLNGEMVYVYIKK